MFGQHRDPILSGLVRPGNVLDPCFSHFFINCGKEVAVPHVKMLVECCTALQVSGTAKSIFKTMYGVAMKKHSNVRWYCFFEQAMQHFHQYPLLPAYRLTLPNQLMGQSRTSSDCSTTT